MAIGEDSRSSKPYDPTFGGTLKPEEKYIVRFQLIRSDKEGEYISQSFDYEVSPTTDPSLQEPLFLRAEKFYKHLQFVFKRAGGKVTVTDLEKVESP